MMKRVIALILVLNWGIGQSQQVLPLLEDWQNRLEIPLPVRVERLEKRLSNKTFLNMFNQLQNLQSEIQQLRGENERLNHELLSLKKRQRNLYLDLDQRMLHFEGATPTSMDSEVSSLPVEPPPAPSASSSQPSPPKPRMQSKTATPEEKQTYRKAYQTLQEGEYKAAIDLFTAFLVQFRQGEYADNAQYWLAEAHYVQREFDEASKAFNAVVYEYPQSPKVKDSLLKTGFIQYEEGNWDKSREILTDVMDRYPNSTVAKLAKARLLKMRRDRR